MQNKILIITLNSKVRCTLSAPQGRRLVGRTRPNSYERPENYVHSSILPDFPMSSCRHNRKILSNNLLIPRIVAETSVADPNGQNKRKAASPSQDLPLVFLKFVRFVKNRFFFGFKPVSNAKGPVPRDRKPAGPGCPVRERG